MTTDAVRYELREGIAFVGLDDGKVNALSHAVLDALAAALDRAEADARAVVLAGRPDRFSAGFDLAVMRAGPDAVRSLVTRGAEVAMRLYGFPRPVVAACTGHAIAMGAFLLLVADVRLGMHGDFKIGLNEVANGMTVPAFGVELARDRLSKRHFVRATLGAEIYSPVDAVDAGFLDRVTAPERLLPEAGAEAARFGALDRGAYARTKRRLHGASIARIEGSLAEDMRRLAAGE